MKGVSDKDAQNNKKIKGDKNNVKKPLQVLHISKKDTISKKEEVVNGHQNSTKEVKTDISAVKPKIIEAPINEVKESYSNNINFSFYDEILIFIL